MFHLVHFQGFPSLMIASSIVFIFLNIIENIIHYRIGKGGVIIQLPDKKDIPKIILVMIIFALLQGILTFLFMQL